jgi:uncharacterized phage infection (PIP) family protein YhgE
MAKYKLKFIVDNIIKSYDVLKELNEYPHILDKNDIRIRLSNNLYNDVNRFIVIFRHLDDIIKYNNNEISVNEIRNKFGEDFWYFKEPTHSVEEIKEKLDKSSKLISLGEEIAENIGNNYDLFTSYREYLYDTYCRDLYPDYNNYGSLSESTGPGLYRSYEISENESPIRDVYTDCGSLSESTDMIFIN